MSLKKFLVLATVLTYVVSVHASRRFTVRDSIEMVTFAHKQLSDEEEDIHFSPNRKYFFAVTSRALLESNRIEGTIWLFDAVKARRALDQRDGPELQPKKLVEMATSSNGEAISEARWSIDSKSILFLGRNKDAARHLFVVQVEDGNVEQLSPDTQDVTEFDCIDSNCVFTAKTPVPESELYESGGPGLPDIEIGTGTSLISLLYPHWEPFVFGTSSQEVWKVHKGYSSPLKTRMGESLSIFRGGVLSHLALSPSGRYAVGIDKVDSVPETWEKYKPAFSFAKFSKSQPNTQPSTDLSPAQYVLMDLSTAEISPLIDAPVGWSAGYFADVFTAKWSADESEVAVSNTFVPISNNAGTLSANSPLRPCVAVVQVASRKTECVVQTSAPKPGESRRILREISWRIPEDALDLHYTTISGVNRGRAIDVFSRDDGSWKKTDSLTSKTAGFGELSHPELTITAHQDLNTPPELMASDSKSGVSKVVWNPNPQLAEVNLGRAEIYTWTDQAGHQWSGGLIKPPDFVAGHRYPLVLQTHGFNPSKFLNDGIYSTANAARALAGRGIIVLQIGEPIIAPPYTPAEAESNGRLGYISAIEQLAKDGIVEPHKVGIIGFSHTGSFVLNALMHSPKYFAAATLAESSYNSFAQYLINVDYRGHEEADAIANSVGAAPFGEGLKTWFAASPEFNTGLIHTPILFEENDPVSLIDGWDLYAALRAQSKPVELLYMRNGEHVLTRPEEILASQSVTVDWYDFWLNNHEDANASKSEQYRRWRKLRDLRQGFAKSH